MGVQKELEDRLKPSQQLQDSLYQAKDGLPVPPDPIKNALDAFAKQALGDIGEHTLIAESLTVPTSHEACHAHILAAIPKVVHLAHLSLRVSTLHIGTDCQYPRALCQAWS